MNDCIGRLLFLFLVLEPYLAAAVTGADRSDTSFGSSDFVVVRVRDSTVVRCLRLPREDLASCPVWTHYPPSYHRFSDTERELNSCDEAYDDRFTLQTNTTVSILSITSIKPEDAGRYECQDDDDQLGFSKEIIVIGDNPKCSSRTHEDSHEKVGNFETRQTQSKLELHCEVGYSGSLNATGQCIVEWRIVGREDVLDSKCIVGDSSVKSTLTLDAVSHSNATSYVCVVRGSAVEQYEQYSCQTGQIDTPLTIHATHVGPRDWTGILTTNGLESKATEDIPKETNLTLEVESLSRTHTIVASSYTAKAQWSLLSFLVLSGSFVLFQ